MRKGGTGGEGKDRRRKVGTGKGNKELAGEKRNWRRKRAKEELAEESRS